MANGNHVWGNFNYTKAVFLPVHDGWKAMYAKSKGRPMTTVKDPEGNIILYPDDKAANDAAWLERTKEFMREQGYDA